MDVLTIQYTRYLAVSVEDNIWGLNLFFFWLYDASVMLVLQT